MKQDLKARAYRFSLAIFKFIDDETKDHKIYYSMIDQLIRCSTSIGANIIEASSASSRKEFIKYYEIALKSANETKYWLCLFRDAMNCDKESTNLVFKEAVELSKILASSLLTLKGKN